MKTNLMLTLPLLLSLLLSCEHPEVETTKVEVSVATRSSTDGTCDLFPVHVYAFFPDGECVDHQTLENAGDPLLFTLPPGNYTFYALAGISGDRYTLPGVSTASASYRLELIDPAAGHAEVGTARADIVVSNEEKGNLELTITRVVAQIDASVFDLPENITGVVMSFNPLETQLLLDGTFGENPENKEIRFTLTEENPGEWHTADPVFVFPSEANITIGIVLTYAGGEKRRYSYNTSFGIKANYKYEINATYIAGSPDLSGVIKGTDWAGEEEYAFDFGEGESENAGGEEGGEEESVDSPTSYAAGDFYNENCYILHAEETTEGKTVLTLLSPKGAGGHDLEGLKNYIEGLNAGGFSGWKMFSEKDARIVNQLCSGDLTQLNDLFEARGIFIFEEDKYLYEDAGVFKVFNLTGTFMPETVVNGIRYYVRGVKKITVTTPH